MLQHVYVGRPRTMNYRVSHPHSAISSTACRSSRRKSPVSVYGPAHVDRIRSTHAPPASSDHRLACRTSAFSTRLLGYYGCSTYPRDEWFLLLPSTCHFCLICLTRTVRSFASAFRDHGRGTATTRRRGCPSHRRSTQTPTG